MIVHDDELCTLYLGDCVEVMAELPADSIDAIVTDPPYGLEFMGKAWDSLWHTDETRERTTGRQSTSPLSGKPRYGTAPATMQSWHEAWAREAFRVAKPGAHLLAFGGTRTYHRLASAIEDAGWEIRDCLVWAYASGFPKSLDVSKAIDKAAGTDTTADERWRAEPHFITGKYKTASGKSQQIGQATPGERHVYEPATSDAEKWNGWGTALKPAWEPIVMARKPLRGTVAANILAHGTGALNIDATRIGTPPPSVPQPDFTKVNGRATHLDANARNGQMSEATGRWPANLILTDPIFDGDTPGVVGGGATNLAWTRPSSGTYEPSAYGLTPSEGEAGPFYGDSGTYSRFFELPHGRRGILSVCPICGASDAGSSSTARTPEADTAPPSAAISPPESSAQPASSAGSQSGLWSTDSAPSPAPTEESSDSATRTDSPTTSATEKPSSPAPSAPTSRTRPSPGSRRGRPSPTLDPASPAAPSSTSSATTTTTPSQQWCDSCVADAMRSSMAARESVERNYPWAFLIPKSSRSDREPVLRGQLAERDSMKWSGGSEKMQGIAGAYPDGSPRPPQQRENAHPTVKPLDLMRHLVRLVTPPGGVILDCFLGSGTTAIAANAEGFRCIGIEKEREYLDIALARMAHQPLGLGLDVVAPTRKAPRLRAPGTDIGSVSFWGAKDEVSS